MAYYLSSTPGIGGRLRTLPEDFEVDEVPFAFSPSTGPGKYTVARVRARNWETNRLMQELTRRLGVGRNDVFFAGTKDKRAVTTQYVSLRAPEAAVKALDIRDVDILETFRVDRAPKIGELAGNRFGIVVRALDASPEESLARAESTLAELRAARGFPNYYGVQRFGVVRPVTHVVGERILRGDLEGAVDAYVADPLDGEQEENRAARTRYAKERDPQAALGYYPGHMSFERSMLAALAHGGTHADALRAVPRNLLTMFVYAYQSLLFNRILSRRLERGLLLSEAAEGDLVCAADAEGRPDRDTFIPVTATNLPKVNRRLAEGKAFLTGLVPGSEPPYAAGVMGEVEREILDEAGITPDEFLAERLPESASRGTRRELLAPLGEVTAAIAAPDGVRLRFFLPRGSYATCLFREVMKTDARAY